MPTRAPGKLGEIDSSARRRVLDLVSDDGVRVDDGIRVDMVEDFDLADVP